MGFWGSVGGALAGSVAGPIGMVGGGLIGNTIQNDSEKDPNAYMNAWDAQNKAPDLPAYQGVDFNAPTMDKVQAATIDQRGLDAYRNQALGDVSPWTQLQNQQNAQLAQQQSQDIGAQNSAQVATARDNIAAGGGLTSGAAERLGNQGIQSSLLGQQGVQRNLMNANTNVGIAGRNQQLEALRNLPGMDLAQAQFNQNINNTNFAANNAQAAQKNEFNLQEAKRKSDYLASKYNTDALIYGTNKQAAQQQQHEENKHWYNPTSWF